MKKFLVLSAMIGLAGLGIGIAGRQGSRLAALAPATAVDVTTSSSAVPSAAAAPTTATTKRPAGNKTASTTTTHKASSVTSASVLTTTTTRPATTTTTTAVPTQVGPTCTVSAARSTGIGGGVWEAVTVNSNTPAIRTRMTVKYPTLQQQFWVTTGSVGSATKTFQMRDVGPTVVSIDFYDAAENHIGGSPACQTTFESVTS